MSPKKIKFILGALLILGSIGYLISVSISKTSMYFMTVGELATEVGGETAVGIVAEHEAALGAIWTHLLARAQDSRAQRWFL